MRLSSLLYIIFIIKLVRSEKNATFNVSQPDLNNTTLETRQDSGIEIKTYSPRDGFRIESVKYGDKELWSSSSSGQEACKSIQFHSKGETKLLALWVVNNNGTLDIKRFNKVGTEWKSLELEDFNKKIREAKGRAPVKTVQPTPQGLAAKPATPVSQQGPVEANAHSSVKPAQQGGGQAYPQVPPATLTTIQGVQTPTGASAVQHTPKPVQPTSQGVVQQKPPQEPAAKVVQEVPKSAAIPQGPPTQPPQGQTPAKPAALAAKGQAGEQPGPVQTNEHVPQKQPRVNGQQTSIPAQKSVEQPNQMATSTPQVPQVPSTKATVGGTISLPNASGGSQVPVQTEAKNHPITRQSVANLQGIIKEAQPKEEAKEEHSFTQTITKTTKENVKEKCKSSDQPVSSTPLEPNILDITKLDSSKFTSFEYMFEHVSTQLITPIKGVSISKLMNGKEEMWTPGDNERCRSCAVYSKNNAHLLALYIRGGGPCAPEKYFEKVDGKWNSISKEDFLKKYDEMRSGLPYEKLVLLSSKIDSAIFNVRVSSHNGVPLLTCTAKPGVLATKLQCGNETIWDGGKKALFLSALIYFKGDKPKLVTLQCKENDKNLTLFLHKDETGKWIDDEEEHERKLKELKYAVKPKDSPETAKGHV